MDNSVYTHGILRHNSEFSRILVDRALSATLVDLAIQIGNLETGFYSTDGQDLIGVVNSVKVLQMDYAAAAVNYLLITPGATGNDVLIGADGIDTDIDIFIDGKGSGQVVFGSFPVTPSAAPTADYEVANKKYVDDNIGGGGDVYLSGAPSNNQVAVWTDGSHIEGDSDLTFDGDKLTVKQLFITTPTAGIADYDAFLVLDVTGTEVKTRTGANVLSDIGGEAAGTAAGLIGTHESTYNHSHYDTAYGWGDHSIVGYLTDLSGFTLDDLADGVTYGRATLVEIAAWNALVSFPGFTDLLTDYGFTDNSSDWDTAYGWGNHAGLYDTVGTAAGLVGTHEFTYNHANYNTAYGWGDHSAAGYITGVAWGDITGTLSSQIDLQGALDGKYDEISAVNGHFAAFGSTGATLTDSGYDSSSFALASHDHARILVVGQDTSIELTDTGTDGMIVFTADGNEKMRIDKTYLYLKQNVFTDRFTTASATNIILGVDAAGAGTLNHTSGDEGWYNTLIGKEAGMNLTIGEHNVFIGALTGRNIDTGIQNFFLGSYSGRYLYHTSSNNVAIGFGALEGGFGSVSACDGNLAIGDSAGSAIIDGASNNIFIGAATGWNLTTGSENIFIGVSIQASSVSISNELNIGNILYGDMANDLVGIGSKPTSAFFLTKASTTSYSSLQVPHGTAPTSPVNGDIWTTTDGLFARINGVTKNVSYPNLISQGNTSVDVVDAGTGYITFTQDGAEKARVHTNGYFGINQTSPSQALHVTGEGIISSKLVVGGTTNSSTGLHVIGAGSTSSDYNVLIEYGVGQMAFRRCSANTGNSLLLLQKSRGTVASPAVVTTGDNIMQIRGEGHDGTGWVSAGWIRVACEGTIGTGVIPGLLIFATANSSGTIVEGLRMNSSQNVAIGTHTPDTRLDVNGALTLRELSADPSDPDEGAMVIWMSDGTGTGDDGDIIIKITAGGATKTTTLVDFSTL